MTQSETHDMEISIQGLGARQERAKGIKCLIWDLDNTLWDGVLLEGDKISLKDGVGDIIKTLDGRGILQSIASKNEHTRAMAKLQAFGLQEYFLYPQINWNSKVASIKAIAESINIGLDTIAFIDDQSFEREEVRFSIPQALIIDAADLDTLLEMPAMNPKFITEDSARRRLMYLADHERKAAEKSFVGPQEEFLATLNMIFTISPAQEKDLQRAEELTVRTNQLNTTGYTYSYEELDYFRRSERHRLLVASLDDKYGSYGKIGLALLECGEEAWTIKLLLMSCRVMSRGVGSVLLGHIINQAKTHNVRLYAEFVPTDVNRMMYVTYKFAGFKELEERGGLVILENDLARVQSFPEYVDVRIIS
jgi:FkbH-like protein